VAAGERSGQCCDRLCGSDDGAVHAVGSLMSEPNADVDKPGGCQGFQEFGPRKGTSDTPNIRAAGGRLSRAEIILGDNVASPDPTARCENADISASNLGLSTDKLITQLLITTSTDPSGKETSSIIPFTNSYADIKAIIEEPSADIEVPVQHVREIVSTDVPTRRRIFIYCLQPVLEGLYSLARFLILTSTRTERPGIFTRVARVEHGKQDRHCQFWHERGV
jgi:hypothetical protein